MTCDPRRYAPATARNREPILAALQEVLPPAGTVLEVASGTGEHAAYFAPRLNPLVWRPSERSAESLSSIAAHCAEAGAPTAPPVHLDVTIRPWPVDRADAVFCCNMIHIAPWRAAVGLFAGAAPILPDGAPLILYGPFMRGGRHTAPSNEAFDRQLRELDPEFGIRSLEAVTDLAAEYGFTLDRTVDMPANNLTVVFRRRIAGPSPT